MENIICILTMVFTAGMFVYCTCVTFTAWKCLFNVKKVDKNSIMAVIVSTSTTVLFAVCTVVLFNQLSF